MRPRATLGKPAILTRRLFALLVRSAVIGSMSFAVSFGFISGATSPQAHYDPQMFAIGVAALLGAACGAIGILISRIRQMKAELRDLEARVDKEADRNWEMREAQERSKSFFEAQGDVIVRRDGDRRGHLRQRRFLRARRPAARGPARHHLQSAGRGAEARPAFLPTARGCTTRRSLLPPARAGSPGAK